MAANMQHLGVTHCTSDYARCEWTEGSCGHSFNAIPHRRIVKPGPGFRYLLSDAEAIVFNDAGKIIGKTVLEGFPELPSLDPKGPMANSPAELGCGDNPNRYKIDLRIEKVAIAAGLTGEILEDFIDEIEEQKIPGYFNERVLQHLVNFCEFAEEDGELEEPTPFSIRGKSLIGAHAMMNEWRTWSEETLRSLSAAKQADIPDSQGEPVPRSINDGTVIGLGIPSLTRATTISFGSTSEDEDPDIFYTPSSHLAQSPLGEIQLGDLKSPASLLDHGPRASSPTGKREIKREGGSPLSTQIGPGPNLEILDKVKEIISCPTRATVKDNVDIIK
jgi:hypothetical protein